MASLGSIFIGEGLYYLFGLSYTGRALVWVGIGLAFTAYRLWRSEQRLQVLLATVVLGLIFFAGMSSLVLLDALRSALF